MMKKIQTLSLSLALLASPSAMASLTVTLYDTTYNNYSPGGEYNAVTTGGSYLANYSSSAIRNGGFETFCIDKSTTFSYGVAYDASLSSYIVGNSGNQLSLGAAYLYSEFAAGSLSGYNYTTTSARQTSAAWLQKTLWALEGQYSSTVFGASNPFYNLLLSEFSTIAGAQANAAGAYGVQVLQLTDSCGNSVQSQLVQCGTPSPNVGVVPEPATVVAGALLLLPFGVSTLRIIRRKHLAK
jgi:hypothetical protein